MEISHIIKMNTKIYIFQASRSQITLKRLRNENSQESADQFRILNEQIFPFNQHIVFNLDIYIKTE